MEFAVLYGQVMLNYEDELPKNYALFEITGSVIYFDVCIRYNVESGKIVGNNIYFDSEYYEDEDWKITDAHNIDELVGITEDDYKEQKQYYNELLVKLHAGLNKLIILIRDKNIALFD